MSRGMLRDVRSLPRLNFLGSLRSLTVIDAHGVSTIWKRLDEALASYDKAIALISSLTMRRPSGTAAMRCGS
jgi:hypothetical protein